MGKLEKSEWALQEEAIRIFNLGDKDGSGFIDLAELANMRNSAEFAETMMGVQDENKDGKLSLAEWLTYVKAVFDKKESACKGLLKLYEKQINENKEIKLQGTPGSLKAAEQAETEDANAEPASTAEVVEETPVVSVQAQEKATQPPANLGFFSCCAAAGATA